MKTSSSYTVQSKYLRVFLAPFFCQDIILPHLFSIFTLTKKLEDSRKELKSPWLNCRRGGELTFETWQGRKIFILNTEFLVLLDNGTNSKPLFSHACQSSFVNLKLHPEILKETFQHTLTHIQMKQTLGRKKKGLPNCP